MIDRALFAAVIVAAACSGSDKHVLLAAVADAPPEIRSACELVTHRCTQCHTLDRVNQTRMTAPENWRTYVRWMRLHPASQIPASEEPTLVTCLVYRDFGPDGLATLAASPEAP
jgi:hypothetical protein